MKVIKVYNNNCILSSNAGSEMVLTGSGIGFQKKTGDPVDQSKIEKSFLLVDKSIHEFEQMINSIPLEYFYAAQDIVDYAKSHLEGSLNEKLLITLTDHIYYAIERARDNMSFTGLFSNEMRLFYQAEYTVGLWSIDLLNQRFEVELTQDEASFIAIHLINANSKQSNNNDAQRTIQFLHDVLAIIEKELKVTFQENTSQMQRLSTHLIYLAQRVIKSEIIENSQEDEGFFNELAAKFNKYLNCVNKISNYTEKKYGYALSLQERIYLAIHFYQIIKI